MQSLDNEKWYINILASALSIVEECDEIIGEIDAASNYSKYSQDMKNKLDSILSWEDIKFLENLANILEEIKTLDGEKKVIYAIEFCKWC